mmetsp:Transcript_45165/g.105582  ORF Transcript_45165/g.105582 Transcript_45165/m.105582 type:complete len:344 (+) Transcript_45165:319-1350(+)
MPRDATLLDFIPGDSCSQPSLFNGEDGCTYQKRLDVNRHRFGQLGVLADPELMSNSKKNMHLIPLRECEHLQAWRQVTLQREGSDAWRCLAASEEGLHRHVHAVHQRPPCGRSCGRRPKVEHMQSPGHKARSVVAALIILVSNIGGHELCFIQGLANATAVILQQPTVHHQLDLTVSYAAGAGLGDIREDCELGSRVPDEHRGCHREVVPCNLLGLLQLPSGPEISFSLQHLPAVAVCVASAVSLDVGAYAGNNLLSPTIIDRNITHGVRNFHMLCTTGQTSPLRDPGTDLLVHLVGKRPTEDLHEGQAGEDRKCLGAVGPEDVGTTGLRARRVAHGCIVPHP